MRISLKKVLIIEDERNIRETLSDLFQIHGYEVTEASNGPEGVEKAMKGAHDVILCDVNMPGMDGYQVLRELMEQDRLTLVPFIFLTAKSSMEELRTGMELGADDYLTKPFAHESLMRAIKTAEEKKLSLINRLNGLQNQLNLEKLKIQDIDQLNSHQIRRKLSVMQGLFPLIRSGEYSLEEGMKIVEASGEELDQIIHRISEISNDSVRADRGYGLRRMGHVKSIWLIDDDATQNLLTHMLLRKTNPEWVIDTFPDPEVALHKLSSGAPDLIFLDINMPRMDGFEFLKHLSKHPTNLQVIMLSSSVSEPDINRSLSYAHVVNYLTKPLKKERLTELFQY